MSKIVSYLALGLIPAFLLLDAVRNRRDDPPPYGWRLRGGLITAVSVGLASLVAWGWALLLQRIALFDLGALGSFWGAIVGLVVYEFVYYWYHRAIHRSDALWRIAHQMHHSAERVDGFGAYFQHPVDVFCATTWASLIFVPLLGLSAEAAALAAAARTFATMFQHANIATPHWLGYVIQRPESHRVHHGRGVHHYNYAALPLWDIVFNTFVNPRDVGELRAGFYDGASARVAEMLVCRDVTLPDAPKPNMNQPNSRED